MSVFSRMFPEDMTPRIMFVLLIKLLVIIAAFIIEPVWTFLAGINALWMYYFMVRKWLPAGMKRFWTILVICLVGWPIGMLVYPFATGEAAALEQWFQPIIGILPWVVFYGIPLDVLESQKDRDDSIVATKNDVPVSGGEMMPSRICPTCHHQAENSELFCSECGTKLENLTERYFCRSCGSALKQDVSFCAKCGTKREVDSGKCISLFSGSNETAESFDDVQGNESTNQDSEQKPKSSSSWMCGNNVQSFDYQEWNARHKRKLAELWVTILSTLVGVVLGLIGGYYFEQRAAEIANRDRITLDTPLEELEDDIETLSVDDMNVKSSPLIEKHNEKYNGNHINSLKQMRLEPKPISSFKIRWIGFSIIIAASIIYRAIQRYKKDD